MRKSNATWLLGAWGTATLVWGHHSSALTAASLIVLGAALALAWSRRVNGGPWLTGIVLVSYALQVTVTLVLYLASNYHWPLWSSLQLGEGFWQFTRDAPSYHANALRLLEAFSQHRPLPKDVAAPEFVLLLTTCYKVWGPHPLLPCLLNAWWRAAGTILVYLVGRRLLNEQAGRRAALLAGCWPSWFIWGSQLLREQLTLATLFGTFYGLVSTWQAGQAGSTTFRMLRPLILLGAGVFLLAQLRAYMVFILLCSCFVVCVAAGWRRLLTGRRGLLSTAVVVFVTVVAAFSAGRMLNPTRWLPTMGLAPLPLIPVAYPDGDASLVLTPQLGVKQRPADASPGQGHARLPSRRPAVLGQVPPTGSPGRLGYRVDWLRQIEPFFFGLRPQSLYGTRYASLERAHTVVAPAADISDVMGMLRFLPVGLAAGFFSPWPWQWFDTRGDTGGFKKFAVLEVFLICLLLPSMLLGLVTTLWLQRLDRLYVAVFAMAGLTYLIFTVASVGGLFRLRSQFLMPLAILGCAAERPSRWHWYTWGPALQSAGRALRGA